MIICVYGLKNIFSSSCRGVLIHYIFTVFVHDQGMGLVLALHVQADIVIFVLIYLQQRKLNAVEEKDKDA